MQKMKAITAVCSTGASVTAISANGRVSRPNHPHRDGENAEMKMYLSKLKDLVPYMPKNRKLSKLEIIQNVIDYICDLQSELETHPAINNFDAAAVLSLQQHHLQQHNSQHISADERINYDQLLSNSSPVTRQPLVDRQSPNTILSTTHNSPVVVSSISASSGNSSLPTSVSSSQSHATTDKSSSDRPHC